MSIISMLFGIGLLFFGRRAFWLFVAGAGFVAGLSLTNRLVQAPEGVGVIAGLVLGLLAAMLAITVQRFAIRLAGFLVGGYIAVQVLPFFNLDSGWATLAAFIIGGLIGIVMIGMFLGWALISLSSLAGAALFANTLNLDGGLGMVVFIILVVIGVLFQSRELRRKKR